ncbi:MAG: helix-turn-helix transcriptional regulator [Lentimicrobiaceae bacterium]|nr:helix-turn-helix transcriptional regulator [Lentimicrobiaceae bacterium]
MELIKDRLAHIIRAKNLTATQFAEMMQIQPSNVSHLLSGRNNPSLDFLKKLKELFPEYNLDWIILGKKPITVSEPFLFSREDEIPPSDENLFTDIDLKDNEVIKETSEKNITDDTIRKISDDIATKPRQIIYVYDDHTFEIFNIRK